MKLQRIVIALVITTLYMITGCSSNNPNYERPLSEWLPEKDMENHAFVDVANALWMFGRQGEDVYDIKYQNEWQEACEKKLVSCFDSIHPNTPLLDYQKVDSMLIELEAFFKEDVDYSTFGMTINNDIFRSFFDYRIIVESKELINREPSFQKEVKAWNKLEKALDEFCLSAELINSFGGTIGGVMGQEKVNVIKQSRIGNLALIRGVLDDDRIVLSGLRGNWRDRFLDDAEEVVVKVKENAKNTIEEVGKEYLDMDEYRRLEKKLGKAHNRLVKNFGKWCKERRYVFDNWSSLGTDKRGYLNHSTSLFIFRIDGIVYDEAIQSKR